MKTNNVIARFIGNNVMVDNPRITGAGSAIQVYPIFIMKNSLSALRRALTVAVVSLMLLSSSSVQAVPLLLNFQGRVTVDGTVFTGTGQFKFALVNADGSQSYWSNDGSSSAGAEPTDAVAVTVTNGNYALHLGDTALTNMGALQATVFANDPVLLRIWFSDGTNGFELLGADQRLTSVAFALQAKSAEVAATVTTLSADFVTEANLVAALRTKLANLQTEITTLQSQVTNIANTNSGGNNGAGVGVSSIASADNGDGSFKLTFVMSDGTTEIVNTPNLTGAAGVQGSQGQTGAAGADGSKGDTGTAGSAGSTGVSVVSAATSDNGDGTFNVLFTLSDNSTQTITTPNLKGQTGSAGDDGAPGPTGPKGDTGESGTAGAAGADGAQGPQGLAGADGAQGPAGSGGGGGQTTSASAGAVVASASVSDSTLTGGGYVKFLSIAADAWSASPGAGAPSSRFGQGSAWTGSGMAIWGGNLGSGNYLGTGATYNPATDTWASITPLDAPDARSDHSTVWSGTELIVWGGYGSSGPLGGGGRYQASIQSWLPLNSTGAPSERYNNAAVWTGSRMLVWGGRNNTGILNDGAVYDPGTDAWAPVDPSGGPAARYDAASVVAGDTVLVWGGQGATGALGDGASLALTSGVPSAWSAITTTGAPSARSGHAAAWTGSKLIVWGGIQGGTYLNDGGIYDPAVGQGGTWAAMSTTGAPAARENHAAVWTGSELVVIGGEGVSGSLADSHAYNPATDTWRSLSGSTGARSGSSSEWTGSQILVFGGESDGQVLGQPMEINPTPPVHLYRKQ
jgi:hypothetical protein